MTVGDAQALIGILANLEGLIWTGRIGVQEVERFRAQLQKDGVLGAGTGEAELRQAIGDLNQRLRYSVGEYTSPPPPEPIRP